MFLGIDLGTTDLKVLILSDKHEVIAVERSPLTVNRPKEGWSEQSPED